MLIESVGVNDRASYYAGINATLIKILVYVLSGMCAAIAGIVVGVLSAFGKRILEFFGQLFAQLFP